MRELPRGPVLVSWRDLHQLRGRELPGGHGRRGLRALPCGHLLRVDGGAVVVKLQRVPSGPGGAGGGRYLDRLRCVQRGLFRVWGSVRDMRRGNLLVHVGERV